jgi:general secretion pathway protein M
VTLQERFAKLEPRERTLLLAFGGVIAAIVFFVVPFYLHRMVQTARDDNQEIRDFIQTVGESRKKIEANKLARDAMLARYSKTIPASLIDDAAKSNEVEIAETQKKPDVPHGKRFVEHVTTVKLHKPGMYGLSKMLEKLETSGYPVSISRLDIKPRAGEADSYDVELGVSTFERKNDAKPEKSGAKPEGSASSKDEEL